MKKTKLFWRLIFVLMITLIASLSSIVVNASSNAPSASAITYYEAEEAARVGSLWEGDYTLASGGKVITQISSSNNIIFSVEVAEAGEYDVQVHYASYSNHSYRLIVNGLTENAAEFKCLSNYSWGENPFGMISTSVNLNAGLNTIKLDSTVTAETDTRFDRIGISKAIPKYNNNLQYSNESSAPLNSNSLWYRQPADKWASSLPLGNGRIGAMVWGGIYEDTVSLNEVTCWSGEDHTAKSIDNPDGPKHLSKIQEEFQKPNPDRAIIAENFGLMGGKSNDGFGTSRPFGLLKFNFEYKGSEISSYRRTLDLNESVSYVDYSVDGAKYSREAFVSNPDQVMIMKYSSDTGESISFDVNFALEEPAGGNGIVTVVNDTLTFDGKPASKSEIDTHAQLKAIPSGGTVIYDEYGIHINEANEVVLILALGTSFDEDNIFEVCSEYINNASNKEYTDLKTRHIDDAKTKFDRMSLEIGNEQSDLPTDERVENIRNGAELDGNFVSLWYQYSRYLMLAGSREDSPLPMHLQGIWNDNVSCNMIWNCDYHLDINIQMNQWMSNASNLSEGEKPIFSFMKNYLIPSGKVTAQTQFGKKGWTVGIVTNPWGYSGNTGSVGAWEGSTTSGGWLAQEIMNYFDHTWDKEFLQNDGLPMLKETADFFLDYIVEYSQDINPADNKGYLVTIPGSSPENGDLEVMPAYDRTIIYDIFYQVLRCYDILELPKDEYYDIVKSSLDRLAPYKISKFGQLSEWPYNDTTDGASEHRTTSNLLGVFPYDQITPDKTPSLARASLLSMDRKFELEKFEHTEWTCVNAQGMYARFKNGEKSFDYLRRLATTFTWPNLLSISPEGIGGAETDVYIIDGVLGMASGVNEMLMQSHSERLEFLPALPNEWESGSVTGMVGRGAFEADFKWNDYKLMSAKITSKAGNKCSIYRNSAANWSNVMVYKDNGDNSFTPISTTLVNNSLTFDTESGSVYVLRTKTNTELSTGYIINDTDPRISWTNFSPGNTRGLGDYMDDVHYAQGADASFELQFIGTGIDLITERHYFGEKVEIYIDDEFKGIFSASQPERDVQYILYSIDGLDYGQHKIKGITKSENENEQYLEVDAFAVHGFYGAYLNDDSPQIEYSDGWERFGNRHEYNLANYCDDIHFTNKVGSTAKITFEGTGIEILGEKYSGAGSVDLILDGISVGEAKFDNPLNGSRDVQASIYHVDGLTNKSHTLEIISKGGDVTIDAFILKNEGGDYFEDGVYKITNSSTNEILTRDDDKLSQIDNLGGYNQQWYIEKIDETYSNIISANSGLMLSTNSSGYSIEEEAKLDDSQLWNIMPSYRNPGYYIIENKKTGSYLQVDANWPYDGAGVSPYQYSRQDNYDWKFNDMPGGFTTIQRQLNNSIIEIVIDDGSEAKGRALINSLSVSNLQKWKVESLGNNSYKISNIDNGKVIGYSNGEFVITDWADNDSNKWTIKRGMENAKECYIFTNIGSGESLLNSNWIINRMTDNQSVKESAPFGYDLKTDGEISAGSKINFSYKYKNVSNIKEYGSIYNAYLVENINDDIKAISPFDTGNISSEEEIQIVIPESFENTKAMIFEVVPKTATVQGANAYLVVTNPKYENLVKTNKIYTETFDSGTTSDIIKNNQNGWYNAVSGTGARFDFEIKPNENTGNSFGFIAKDTWYANGWTGLDFRNTGNENLNDLKGKVYVEFDVKFTKPDNFDPNSTAYINILGDGVDNRFATLRLRDFSLDIIGLDDDLSENVKYNLATQIDNIYDKWNKVGIYTDTENNTYSVKINDELISTRYGNNLTPSNSTILGEATQATIGRVKGIEVHQDWYSLDAGVWVDNLEIGEYEIANDPDWCINSLKSLDEENVCGTENNFNIQIKENKEVQNGKVYIALYKDDIVCEVKIFDNIEFDASGRYNQDFKLNIPQEAGTYTINAFLWKDEMNPIIEKSSLTINAK